MARHILLFPDGEKAILDIGWDPGKCSIKIEVGLLDPQDQSWMEFPADEIITIDDEEISKEIKKIASRDKNDKQ